MTTSYVAPSDLATYGLPATALATTTSPQQSAACEEASRELDGRVAGRYGSDSLPFVTWDTIITGIAARIAVYRLMTIRGYNPAAGQDDLLYQNFKAAIVDCEKIQKQQLHPRVTFTSAKATPQPVVISSSVINVAHGTTGPNRGW